MMMISLALKILSLFLIIRILLSLKSLLYYLQISYLWLDDRCHAYQTYNFHRYAADSDIENPLFRKIVSYLNSLSSSLEDSATVSIFSGRVQVDTDTTVSDFYLGSRLSWHVGDGVLCLRVRRYDRHRVLRPYLQHVETVADDIESRRKEVRLYCVKNSSGWSSVPFSHPATMDTVAVDTEIKARVKTDLEAFLKGKGYYARLGRVWKRSYLLYGPPGTGKSMFVAAMAKFLNYDIYDLDLSIVTKLGLDLKSILLKTSPKSIILVEDFDRYLSSTREEMLNFTDGVFSCCGDERVMVFTTKEIVDDVALLRPGRLDVHVHFPLCDFTSFKTLAISYLGLKDHKLYPQVEEGFSFGGTKLSHAEVGEIMIANRGSPSRAIKTVISVLNRSSSSSLKRNPSNGGSVGSIETDSGQQQHGFGFGKDATVREFKKLYGLIKTRSRKEETMTVQMAAAAAATANAAAAANAANYLDRSFEKESSF